MRARRPWYGVAYYVLGAQGSFFAWLLSAFGVFLTYREAALYALNRAPHEASAADIVASRTGYRRWVEVAGVEVDMGLLRADGATGPIDTVLIGLEDETARALSGLLTDVERRLAEVAGAGDEPTETDALLALDALTAGLRGRHPWPKSALVVVNAERQASRRPVVAGDPSSAERRHEPAGSAREGGEVATEPEGVASSPTPTESPREGGVAAVGSLRWMREAWRRKVVAEGERVRSAIRPGVRRTGLLTPLPMTSRDGYRASHGVEVADAALVVGHRPSDLAAWLFVGFGTLLFLLVIGLFALRSAEAAPSVASPEPKNDELPATA